jgi:predicted transposase YdaD
MTSSASGCAASHVQKAPRSSLPYLVEDRARLREQAPSAYRRLKQSSLPDFARRQCLDVFQSWLLARFDDLTLEEILAMLGELTPLEQTRAYREIVEKNRPIWFDEGHQEGRQREACTLILRLFGPLTSEREARITALPLERLEDLGEALLDFTTSADLDSWLARYE